MAGNAYEWTVEMFSSNNRVTRGFTYFNSSSAWYAGLRVGNDHPIFPYSNFGSRMSLYIKDPYISSKSDEIICSISANGSFVRNYYKYNNEEAITGVMFFKTSDYEMMAPILVSKSKTAVIYYTDHDKQPLEALGSIEYNGEIYYYSSNGQWLEFFDCIPNYPLINTKENMFTNMEDAALRLLQIYFEE